MSFDQDPNETAQISGSDFAQMCDEMKQLRAERDALRAALQLIRDEESSDGRLSNCIRIARAALATSAPAALATSAPTASKEALEAMDWIFSKEAQAMTPGRAREEIVARWGAATDAELAARFGKTTSAQ